MTSTPRDPAGLAGPVQAAWHRFLDVYEPLRPELYRYCRYLTRSPSPCAWEYQKSSTGSRVFENAGRRRLGPVRIVRDDIAGDMARIKAEAGRDVVIFAGGTLASTFVNLGLIDTYRLMVHPILLAGGQPVFRGIVHDHEFHAPGHPDVRLGRGAARVRQGSRRHVRRDTGVGPRRADRWSTALPSARQLGSAGLAPGG